MQNNPENLLLTPKQVYDILNRHKVSLKDSTPTASAVVEILEEASKAIEAEVEKRLKALAPPDTMPQVLRVRLVVDPTLIGSSKVDFESYQRSRAAHILATALLDHLPLSKCPSENPLRVGRPLELWTWEGAIFVKPENKNADSL